MPVARFQMPDGRIGRFEVPDGTTPEQAQALISQSFGGEGKPSAAQQVASDHITQGALDFNADASFGQNVAAGAGKAIKDIGRGAAQLVGLGPSAQETRETRQRDATLMRTGGGITGNLVTNLGMLAPAALLPGAGTVVGAGTIGAMQGALQPTETTGARLKNMGLGFGLGAGAQYVGTAGATALGERAARNAAEQQTAQVQNAVRDAALREGRKAGYVVPPSTVNPSLTNQTVESIGGKIATAQTASAKNQTVTDTLARRGLGLRPNAPLTEATLASMRKTEGQAYEAIKNLPGRIDADAAFVNDVSKIGGEITQVAKDFPSSTKNAAIEALQSDLKIGNWSAAGIVQKVKMLRADAASNFKAYSDPEKLALARAQRQVAEALDDLVERHLTGLGAGDLATNYRNARVKIAQIHDVESALTAGGHVDARVLAKIDGLTGDLKRIADFAGNFPKAVQPGEQIAGPAVHALRPSIGAVGGSIGGGPVGAAVGAAAGVAVPWGARTGMLSGPGQRMMATPSYGGLLSGAYQRNMLPSPETGGLLMRSIVPPGYFGLLGQQE